MNSPSITTLSVNGLQTAHAVAGTGKPIVMLHGWGANLGLVWPLAERLAALNYRVYVPDLPGFGQSQTPANAWSVHDYVKFVLAYLDAHQINQVYLFGHSFGGRLGLVLGAEQPGRIIKMALANTAGVRSKSPLSAQMRFKLYRSALRVLHQIGLKQPAEQLRNWYGSRYGSADYQAVTGVMRETFVKVVNEDLLPYAARAHVPTLLFWGDQDGDTPLWQGKLLEKTMPDAGLVVLEGAGHYSYLDKLTETARVMDYFFKQASPEKPNG